MAFILSAAKLAADLYRDAVRANPEGWPPTLARAAFEDAATFMAELASRDPETLLPRNHGLPADDDAMAEVRQ